jgi:hypothetical protein
MQQSGANVDTLRLMESAIVKRPWPMLFERTLAARVELQPHCIRHASRLSRRLDIHQTLLPQCCRGVVLGAHVGGETESRGKCGSSSDHRDSRLQKDSDASGVRAVGSGRTRLRETVWG